MLLTLGPLQVKIKYTYTRGKTTLYQRAVPSDLHDRYPGKTIERDLKTADPIRVARMVEALNRHYEGLTFDMTLDGGVRRLDVEAHTSLSLCEATSNVLEVSLVHDLPGETVWGLIE